MDLSVALATFNGGRYLAEQLRSIRAQSRPVTQIVLADDGSSDGSIELARRELADWAGELVVLEPAAAPLGVAANFQRAIERCDGELIALCDQDDVWHADKLERLLGALDDGLLVFSDARLVDAAGEPLLGAPALFDGLGLSAAERTRLRAGEAWPVLLRRNVVTGATALLRRELVELAGPIPAGWIHDEWLAIVAAGHGGLRLLEAPTIDYRQHGGNQIGMRAKLSWRVRLERLRAPRTERNARLLARAAVLAERARDWPEPAALDAAGKLEHELVRSALPTGRLGRIAPVLRERASGRYERFGLGAQDALRDLLQPV